MQFIIFIVLSIFFPATKGENHGNALMANLLKNYNPSLLPVADLQNGTVQCLVGMKLRQIIQISEKDQTLTANIRLDFEWKDFYLQWDPVEFGNISEIRLPASSIWTPDILLYNAANENQDKIELATNVIVSSDGKVKYVPGSIIKVACPMNHNWFPFDSQSCKFWFGSWTYDESQINLTVSRTGANLEAFEPHGEWEILSFTATRALKINDCNFQHPYISIFFELKLKRRYLYYLISLIVPSGLIGFLAVLGFALPPESKDKLTLGVTVLFSLITFINFVSNTMPANGSGLPLLGTYYNCVMFTIAMSVISTVILSLNEKSNNNAWPEIWGLKRRILLIWLPRMVGMSSPYNPGKATMKEKRTAGVAGDLYQEEEKFVKEYEDPKMQWRFLALVIDRLCFIIACMVSTVAVATVGILAM